MNSTFALIPFVGCFLCFIVLMFTENSRERAAWGGIGITLLIIVVIVAKFTGEEQQLNRIALGVDTHQVSPAGRNEFRAQARLVFRDGKLESVALIPETMVELPR